MAGINSQSIVLGDNDVVYPYRIGNLYNAANLATTTPVVLATGAPGYYICQLGYQCDQVSTIAVAGEINIVFSDSNFGTFANFRLYVPQNASPGQIPAVIRQVNEGPFVWANKVANTTMSVSIDTALTAGSVRCFIRWGRTQYLG